jgi:phosphoribosylformimino-5-aminoimidazole carboxamide ribotide isomerase
MHLVPVIDLKGGIAVHAQGGRRESYAPVRSALCPSSDPVDVLAAYRGLHGFGDVYIADLDAIGGAAPDDPTLARIKRAFPGLRLWVDNGRADLASCRDWLRQGHGALVLGSESQPGAATLEGLRHAGLADEIVLSLDFRGEDFLGPQALLDRPGLWPPRVIVMTLHLVGSGAGPALDRLEEVRRRAPAARVYAAGGVRGIDDLLELRRHGVSGALIATSLHDGRLGRAEIAALLAATAAPPHPPGGATAARRP